MRMKILNKLFMAEVEKEEGDFQSYLAKLDSGAFKDKMFYGVAEDKRGFLLLDPVDAPGALFCGGMGSGKSVAMRTTLITHMASNSENTIYLLVDTLKGMTDYAVMFDYTENVAVALNDSAKLVPAIEMTYHEMMARKDEFSKVGANNVYSYDKIMRKKDPNHPGIARIILAIEEFHAVPNSEVIKYHMNVDRNGSVAAMLKDIMRVGRSYGIQLLAASQRATSDDFPSSLKPGITQLMAFRVNNPGDATAINLSQAADIRAGERGRCVYEGGFIQFPFLDTEPSKEILKRYYKPLKAKMIRYQMKDFQIAFGGEGNQGMVKVKTLKSLIENYSSFKFADIATRVMEYFNFEVSTQNNKGLPIPLIAKRDGITYGVMLLEKGSSGSRKAVESFKEAMKILKCDSLLAINITGSIPADVSLAVKETNGFGIDLEDLHRIADVLDNRGQLEDEGKFQQLFEKLPLVPKKVEEVVEKPALDKNTKTDKSDIDDLFAQFSQPVPQKKPEPIKEDKKKKIETTSSAIDDLFSNLDNQKEIKNEKEESQKTEKEVKSILKEDTEEDEESVPRPIASTGGGSNLMDLKERLRASLKAKK